MPNLFVKSEYSYNGTFANYKGFGGKFNLENYGTAEVMFARRANEKGTGQFTELKYTTPKVYNIAIESRTRYQNDKNDSEQVLRQSIGQRLALKGSWNLSKKWNIYEIAGVNTKFNLDKNAENSATLMSLTGIGYNATNKLNIYGEIEFSNSPTSVYLGCKYTF